MFMEVLKNFLRNFWLPSIIKKRNKINLIKFKNMLLATEARKLILETSYNNKLYIVHNLYTAPATYGDFIWLIGLINVLKELRKEVNLIIVKGAYSNKWRKFKISYDGDKLAREFFEITEKIDKNNYSFSTKLIDQKEINRFLNSVNHKEILFADQVKKNFPIHMMYFDLISILISQTNLKYPSLSFNKQNVSKILNNLPENYISLHLRYNLEWGENRNPSNDEVIQLINGIKKFTMANIVIVSDHIGCKYFKEIIEKKSKNEGILFSKDFTHSFYEDCELILNSSLYLQFKGGGTSSVPIFSSIPYLIYAKIYSINETKCSEMSIASWSMNNQFWVESNDIDSFLEDLNLFSKVFRDINKKIENS